MGLKPPRAPHECTVEFVPDLAPHIYPRGSWLVRCFEGRWGCRNFLNSFTYEDHARRFAHRHQQSLGTDR